MVKKTALFVLILVVLFAASVAAANAAADFPNGMLVTMTDLRENKILCKVGQAEGLLYPADPASPANYAACDARYSLSYLMGGLSVTIDDKSAICLGTTLVPMNPSNCRQK